jgi:hypothetical protein
MSAGAVLDALPAERLPPARRKTSRADWIPFVLLGWAWRLGVAAVLCAGLFTGLTLLAPTPDTAGGATIMAFNYLAACMVFGWLARRMRAVILRRWWKATDPPREASFTAALDAFGPEGPVRRPRWFWQERILAHLWAPGPDGRPATEVRILGRLLLVPWQSAWRNFALGFKGVVGTSLLLAPAVLTMFAAWEYGWLNSFHKGYEQRASSAIVTLVLGFPLFIVTMFYLPMAQAHFAATGEARSFFDFGLVFRLTRARLWYAVLIAGLTGLASLPLEVWKTVPEFLPQIAATNLMEKEVRLGIEFTPEYLPRGPRATWYDTAPREELLRFLWRYQLAHGLWLFVSLLVLRWLSARAYAGGVLALFRRGEMTVDQLPYPLRRDFERLGLAPVPTVPPAEWTTVAKEAAKWAWRGLAYTLIAVVWVLFAFRVYASEFLHYHPAVGLLNHPLIQVPCVDAIPPHLYKAGDSDSIPAVSPEG